MADSNRTEKPTSRKLNKAREEGNYVVSKEFAAAVQFFAFFGVVITYSEAFLQECRAYLYGWIQLSFDRSELQRDELTSLFRTVVAPYAFPLIGFGALLSLAVLVAQMTVSGLGMNLTKLGPNLARLNPLSRIKEMPRQNLSSCIQAAALLPVFLMALVLLAENHVTLLFGLSQQSVAGLALSIGGVFRELLWKAVLVFLVVGLIDWFRQQSRYTKQLMMSKQEVKDEHKESEGNPQVKGKLRRMQRDMSRRQMILNVPKASAVVVNPTHYSVAIRYEMGAGTAPKVVAKGKNYLARRIREAATAHEIPIVENPPLARALYSAAEVGQEIPPHLYRAVAEILAYLYRILGGRLPGNAAA